MPANTQRWRLTDIFVPDHWLFSPEIQRTLSYRPIPFQIKGVGIEKSLSRYAGCMVSTVIDCDIIPDPPEGKVMVLVYRRSGNKMISIDPCYLVPWEPVVGGEVRIVRGPMQGVLGVTKARVGDRWVVTLTADNESVDREFAQKDIVALSSRRK
jgi:hypothetical protein